MITFFKMEALGNDFIIIDCTKESPKYNLSVLSKFICDRHFSIGADGVIYFYNSKVADYKMRIFNNDGTEAEMCGNGIRCLAKLLYEKKYISETEFDIETLGGIKKIKLDVEKEKVTKIKVNMGSVMFDIRKIPVYLPRLNSNEKIPEIDIIYKNNRYTFFAVDVGNPHVVCFVENFEQINFEELGAYVENYKYFPKKTNVEFVKIENKNKISVKVWERGVGKTLGCGTGAIASFAVSKEKLFTESDIIVELDGGKIETKEENDEYFLIGNAKLVYEGNVII